uniref:Uncharacterized protein n=1 Tax=Nelumbo nucifera TaxID=4432 RepID=A0A822XK34_NELNU|nr:TPA_asm: hypothetical protein HUJ06_020638 [Nelumbo nucifera]
MATRVAVATFAFLSFFVVLANARNYFHLPDTVITEWKDPVNLPDSDAKPIILLPSEKVIKSEKATSPVPTPAAEPEPEVRTIGITTQPLTLTYDISFHPPVKRHFHHMHVKRPFRFPLPLSCDHHYAKSFRGPRFIVKEFSFRNDMLTDEPETTESRISSFNPTLSEYPGYKPGKLKSFPRGKRFWKRPSHWNNGVNSDEEGSNNNPMKRPRVEKADDGEEDMDLLKRFRKFLGRF